MTTPAANPNTSEAICSGLESFPDPRKTSPHFLGQEARKCGEGLCMCPWEMDSAPGRLWIKGWHRDPNAALPAGEAVPSNGVVGGKVEA